MMGSHYGLTIWCDDCDTPPFRSDSYDHSMGFKEAQRAGWTSRGTSCGTKYRCPSCTNAAAEQQAEKAGAK